GDKSPGSGLLVIAIEPTLLDPQFVPRLDDQLHRLKENHNIHVPGETRGEAAADAACNGIDIEQALLDRLLARPIVSPSGKHPINRCLFDHRAHDLLIVHRIIISKEFSVSQSVSQTDRARPLVIPALGKIYGSLHELSETVLR